jgi:hypothetical protein
MHVPPALRAAFSIAALVCSPALFGGCAPPPPAAPAAPAPAPPPKPKPKCEALIEGCKANAKTRARIEGTDLVFTPPSGWIYAQEPEITRSRPKEGSALIGVTTFEDGDAKVRDEAFTKLAASLEIEVPTSGFKKKPYRPAWNKPDDSKKPADVDIKLWQAADAKHGEEKGFLLVLLSPVQGGRSVIGIAFSPDGDDKSIEVIPGSLETLTTGGEK